MYKNIIGSILFLLLLIAFSCTPKSLLKIQEFETRAAQIKIERVPDKSLGLFDIQLSQDGGNWILSGETTDEKAYKSIHHLSDSLLGKKKYVDNFLLLPDSALGDSVYGIVKIAIANLRRSPKHASELIDQTILGNTLKLLRKQKSWFLVQTHYGYIGWMTKYSFLRTDKNGLEAWTKTALLRVKNLLSSVCTTPSPRAAILSRIVLNSAIRFVENHPGWTEIAFPDGHHGFIPDDEIEEYKTTPEKTSTDSLLQTARSMMGVPYLWGGRSSLTNDCSGFTQTVFKAHGIQLPRDARQQVFEGKEVVPESDFSNVKPGDLLFFGFKGRITHVGISLGGYEFIHQDSDVHIDSFNDKASNYNAFRKKSLKKIKRIIN